MKTTILGGILFLIPVAMLAIVLGKAFQLSLLIAEPINKVIPIQRFVGIAFVDLIAILLIIFICFLAGLAARRGWAGKRLEKLDGLMIDAIPGYAVAKGMLGSIANDEDIAAILTPVLVRFDDYRQIAFEIEHDADESVIFLPGAPSTWSGSVVVVARDRVRNLSIPTHQAVKLMRTLGRGSLAVKTAGLRSGNPVAHSPSPAGDS